MAWSAAPRQDEGQPLVFGQRSGAAPRPSVVVQFDPRTLISEASHAA